MTSGASPPPILTCHASQQAAWVHSRQGRLRRREAGMRLDTNEPMRRSPGKTIKVSSRAIARNFRPIAHPSPLDFRRVSVHTRRLIRRPPMTTLWRLTALSDFATLADVVERLDEAYPPVALSWAIFEEGRRPAWTCSSSPCPMKPPSAPPRGISEDIPVEFGPLPEEDWVRLSLQGLKPVDAGRFTLFGAHDRDAVEAGQIGIEIEAGPAFGTGHHGTTRGCLDRLFGDAGCRRRHPGRSSIWAVARRCWRSRRRRRCRTPRSCASDIDPEAVEESAENCTKNTTPGIDCFVAEGLDHPKLAGRQFELIFANILAGPLVELAPGVADILAPGGKVILSGLLTEQEAWVRAAYEAAGLSVHRQPPLEGWETLIASKAA